MGNAQSGIDPVHLRIYSNIIQIQDPIKRVQVINTCLSSMEYVNSAKRAGIHNHILSYVSAINLGTKPSLLPGEQSPTINTNHSTSRILPSVPVISNGAGNTRMSDSYHIDLHKDNTPSWKVITDTPKQKAMTYFASCLEVLGIQEEIALTDETLKLAYKRMALKAHPDKPGGSEEYFEAVTRAYAYLSEILKHMKGGSKRKMDGKLDAPSAVSISRDTEAEKWKHTEPVRLNAKNLDMNAFNKLFEQTHIPDPDSDGYGDWLKSSEASAGNSKGVKFSGEFNRDVFNRVFEEESRKERRNGSSLVVHPGEMALTLNPTSGVDLVGERPNSFTAAPNSRMQFTDLRGAYTLDNTVSDKVSNVVVTDRNYEDYRASRERAPDPFSQTELHGIREFEERQRKMDVELERRRADMHVRNQQYFDRMKQMVITEGIDQNQKKIKY